MRRNFIVVGNPAELHRNVTKQVDGEGRVRYYIDNEKYYLRIRTANREAKRAAGELGRVRTNPASIDYRRVLSEAIAASNRAPAGRSMGATRVYVVPAKEHKRGMKAAAKALGLMWLDNAYGSAKGVIYVGYDNFSGRTLAKGQAMADYLSSVGIDSYMDDVGD